MKIAPRNRKEEARQRSRTDKTMTGAQAVTLSKEAGDMFARSHVGRSGIEELHGFPVGRGAAAVPITFRPMVA
jgi:hypothetical protein